MVLMDSMDTISYKSLIVPEVVSCTVYEIGQPSLYFATPVAFNAFDGGVPQGLSV